MDRVRPRSHRALVRRLLPSVLALGLCLAVASSWVRVRDHEPTVELTAHWVSRAQRGAIVREIPATGRLVAREVHLLTAPHAGRVQLGKARPGAQISSEDIILHVRNPELRAALLKSESELATARAELSDLETSFATRRLDRRANLASIDRNMRTLAQKISESQALTAVGAIPKSELRSLRDQQLDLEAQRSLELERITLTKKAEAAQTRARRSRIEQLTRNLEFERARVDASHIRSERAGLIRTIHVQSGESIAAGAVLATLLVDLALDAELHIAEHLAHEIMLGQRVRVQLDGHTAIGHVESVAPGVAHGRVDLRVRFETALPESVRVDLSVRAVIEILRVEQTLTIRRPAQASPHTQLELFRLDASDTGAQRIRVETGVAAVDTIEIVSGLEVGDRVIVSDMSEWAGFPHIKIR